MYKAILFDLDGTLLPMDMDVFIDAYFAELTKKLASLGYERNELIAGVWEGTGAMVTNAGEHTNEEAFWRAFSSYCGDRVKDDRAVFDGFYENEFNNIKACCGFDPDAERAVDAALEHASTVVLASNPIFPLAAQENRIRWAGIDPAKFSFATSYENCRFCKPDLRYYEDIVKQIGVSFEECLMIGNDVTEDMCAAKLGIDVFLVTPWMINRKGEEISRYKQGTLHDLTRFLENVK